MGKLSSLIPDKRSRKGSLTQMIMLDCNETKPITAKGFRSSISTGYRLLQPPILIAIILYLQQTKETDYGVEKNTIYSVVRLEKAHFLHLKYSAVQTSQTLQLNSDMAQQGVDELMVHLEKAMDLSAMKQGVKLVGSVLANKPLNRWGVRNILRAAWKSYGEIEIK
ncbi:hypothetical protein ACFX1R_006974 [Malus domestica]